MSNVEVVPALLAEDLDIYNAQMASDARYATRVHVDLADGIFTGNSLIALTDIWWPGGMRADLHVMYERPFDHLPALIALGPQLVIVHAEAEGDFRLAQKILHAHGIEVGVALLPETPVEMIVPSLEHIDYVLIFSGHLGHFGGETHLDQLAKVKQLKQLKPSIEIGWDGGANDTNAKALADGGVEVINCGGYLHGDDPIGAYQRILAALGN